MSKKVNNISKNNKVNNKVSTKVPDAPETKVEESKVKHATQVDVIDVNNFTKQMTATSLEGLDPNRRVDLLKMMHETFRMDPSAASRYNISQDAVDKINSITAIGQIAALTCEVVYAKNPFALKMHTTQIEEIVRLGETVGLSIDVKALPAPKEDGTVEIPSTALSVEDKAKDQIKNEKTIENEKPEMDPTKIYDNNDAISKAIQYIFATHKSSIFNAVNEALTFLRSTRLYEASKKENADEAKKAVEAKSINEWFDDLTSLFKPTLLFTGIGKHMAGLTHYTQNPICAFTTLRNASKNKKTGVPAHDDHFIASLTKAIVKWVANTNIESNEKAIANLDPTKNEKEIESCKNAIAHHKETIEYVSNPSVDFARTCIEDLKSEDSHKKSVATNVFANIRKSYYADIDFKKNTFENLNQNLKQYAGIIINLFKDPNERSEEFVESNITELVPISSNESSTTESDEKKPEVKEEKESKKA